MTLQSFLLIVGTPAVFGLVAVLIANGLPFPQTDREKTFAGFKGTGVAEKIAEYSGGVEIHKNTDPFTAETGKLKVVWTMEDGTLPFLINIEGDGVTESVCAFATQPGENRVYVKPGEYYLNVVSGRRRWTATVYEDR